MIINDSYSIWLREMKRFTRARSRLVSSLVLPLVWLVFIGVGFGSSVDLGGMDYISFLAPGIIGMIILFTSIFSGISVIWDRQFGFLKEILVAPISRSSIIIGKTLGGATVALINAFIMFAIAVGLGVIAPTAGIITAVAVMILTSFCFVSIGLIIASNMRSMEGFQAIMSFLIMPVFFLSGALFPLSNTPQWMQAISLLNPLRYGVDGIRSSLIGVELLPLWINISALAGFAAALILIGAYSFRKSTI
jgi:ABC-2 type transport system permease protein